MTNPSRKRRGSFQIAGLPIVAWPVFAAVGLAILFGTTSRDRYIICSESNNIYTVDETRPRVQCLFVRGSEISDTGTLEQIQARQWLKMFGPFMDIDALVPYVPLSFFKPSVFSFLWKTPILRVDPSFIVVPGLADAHAHIIENGWMSQLPLQSTNSIKDVTDRVKTFILSHPDVHLNKTRWVEGMGWDQTRWAGSQFPTAGDLASDPLLVDRPISLTRVDGHARWVSPRVLELMGELPDDVEGGLIVRDQSGRPTGVFIDNAMRLIPAPAWTDEQLYQFFNATMKQALSFGLTSIHDAWTTPEQITFFMKNAEEGTLPNRLYLMGHVPSEDYWGAKIPRLINYGKHKRLTVRSVKLIADGALGSWGAAMLQPYTDKPDEVGLLLVTKDPLRKPVRQFWKDGWTTNIHCIGDRANNVVLDIFEEILTQDGGNATTWRPRIEHAQIFTPQDLERMGRLGIIASVQPTHATSDMRYAEERIGPQRLKGAYAYQSLLRASPVNVLPLGSDFPIEGVNPLLGFYAAVTRLDVDGWSPHGGDGWFSAEKLTRAQALKGMTLDAAYASFAEQHIGSLEIGKKADFVILNRDIMTVKAKDILEATVVATVIDGVAVYGLLPESM